MDMNKERKDSSSRNKEVVKAEENAFLNSSNDGSEVDFMSSTADKAIKSEIRRTKKKEARFWKLREQQLLRDNGKQTRTQEVRLVNRMSVRSRLLARVTRRRDQPALRAGEKLC